MRFVKGIGLFFVYPLTMLALGFYAGIELTRYYDLGKGEPLRAREIEIVEGGAPGETAGEDTAADPVLTGEDGAAPAEESLSDETADAEEVSASSETLYVGTAYVLEETDVLRHTVVETTWSLPDKYVGMNREQFLTAMDTYAASPPLKELERGFVGLEVLSFARERVVVRMNYRYVQPSASFYLAAYDGKVRVYLEDQSTVYIDTEIPMASLPYEVQQKILQMMRIEDEETLYYFLETYSS